MNKEERSALEVLRGYFYELNGVLRQKLDKYRSEGSFSSFLGSNEFDYKDFLITLQDRPFVSETLRDLFESLMHYHFFTYEYSNSLNVEDYIEFDVFKKAEFDKSLSNTVEIVISKNILRSYCFSVLKKYGVEDFSFFDKSNLFIEFLRAFVRAKKKHLEYVGSGEFLVSKILLNGRGFLFTGDLSLSDNIFYTSTPEQIISMARVARPGVYLIANIPYNEYVNTAFYFLIVSDGGDAYIVDNSVHDLRDQFYRNKTDGTSGKDSWLDRRYEGTYLPINQVLKFIEGGENCRDLVVKDKEFPFRVIGKISEEGDPGVVVFCLTFVDECLSKLRDRSFSEGVSPAVCFSFIKKAIDSAGAGANLPILHSSSLPTLSQLDKSFGEDLECGDSSGVVGSLAHLIKEAPLAEVDFSGINPYQLMPLCQLSNKLVFERRKQEAARIEQEFMEGFPIRYPEVRDVIERFIRSHTNDYGLRRAFIERAIKDEPYPYYPANIFGREVPEGEHKITLLYVLDLSDRQGLYSPNYNLGLPKSTPSNEGVCRPLVNNNFGVDSRVFRISEGKEYCDYCGVTKKKLHLTLVFYEYEQFRLFFNLTDKEDDLLPFEFRCYLTQSRSHYRGNHILDDIDPMAMIRNPWWVYKMGLDRYDGLKSRIKVDEAPAIFIRMHLCRRCFKKIDCKCS